MRPFLTLALSVAVAASLACGGGDSSSSQTTAPAVVEKPDPAGSWNSSAAGGTLTMVLANSNGVVSGSGVFSAGLTSVALTITGAYSASATTVSLSMQATGFQTLNFSGQMISTKQMVGTLNGSGFTNTAWVFNKQ
ncbi:MAG: hypothetical protein ACREPM_12755 [Gemmatimonadaceae bacterium]